MKILYLYSKIMPYQIPVIRELIGTYGAEVHVVYWDLKGNAPYLPSQISNAFFYARSEIDDAQLRKLVADVDPTLVYVSGWQDRGYLKVLRRLKKNGVPVVSGFDDNWFGNIRQRIGAIVFPFMFMPYFTHAWISGVRQYEYVKRLGFSDQQIIYHLLSGDTELFSQALGMLSEKSKEYPKNFLFVGRMVSVKAVDVLAEAFAIYKDRYRGDWNLICVGNGPLRDRVANNANIELFEFLDQKNILNLIRRTGAFVLPSSFEPWGVVVHEFASAGLPMILSESVGSRLQFLIENFNGFVFRSGSAEDLAKAMFKISTKSTDDLIEMGQNSSQLSAAHNAKFVAASLMSVVDRG